MDLFYQQETLSDIMDSIRKDLYTYIKDNNIIRTTKRKIRLLRGLEENIGNNVYIISPPFKGKDYFNDQEDRDLSKNLTNFGINNVFNSYCYPIDSKSMTVNDIKTFSTWIHKIVDVIQPRMIVVLGEEAVFSFLKRKSILDDNHGKLIGDHNGIPIYLTYPMSYYTKVEKFAMDFDYIQQVLNNDWKYIQEQYYKLIDWDKK